VRAFSTCTPFNGAWKKNAIPVISGNPAFKKGREVDLQS